MAELPDIIDNNELGSIEYTFSNQELEDVLGFIERRQSGIPLGEDPTLMPLLGPSAPLSLQFQPHPVAEPSGGGPVPADLELFFPAELASNEMGNLVMNRDTTPDPTASPILMEAEDVPDIRGASVYLPTASATKRGDGKSAVSHSTVEKQRRDRINALIDELRDLVPPQLVGEADAGPTSDACRRPKHTVLSDTIALVKELRAKLVVVEEQGARLQEHEISCPFLKCNRKGSPGPPAAADGMPPGGPSPPPGLEVLSLDNKVAVMQDDAQGVVTPPGILAVPAAAGPVPDGCHVDLGDGCLYVKVHCRDRHGLLSDIVRTLKAIPLEITSAAITTTTNPGSDVAYVYDVFQVVWEPGTPTATAERIQSSIEAVMLAGSVPSGGKGAMTSVGKRQRSRVT